MKTLDDYRIYEKEKKMPRPELTVKDKEILFLISKGHELKTIAIDMNTIRENLYPNLKRLQEKGYITKKKLTNKNKYLVTTKGKRQIRLMQNI